MLNIFCVSHQKIYLPSVPGLTLIQAGNQPESFAQYRDNTQDNIADKNPFFSELTAFYYIWKNFSTSFVGFCHYRRYLMPPALSDWVKENSIGPFRSGYLVSEDQLFCKMLEAGDIYRDSFLECLNDADILLPHFNPLQKGGFLDQYAEFHPIYPFFQILALLAEKDKHLGLLAHDFFLNNPSAFWNNLFVSNWQIFDEYCDFLFDLLFRLEERLVLPENHHQQRVFAFLSERLFNFWVWHRGLKVKTVDWCVLDALTDKK